MARGRFCLLPRVALLAALVTAGAAAPSVLLAVPVAAAADGASVSTDGVDDFVTMGPALGLDASSFTVEAWFRRTGAGVVTNTSGTTGGGLRDVVPLVTKGRGESDGSNVDLNYFLGIGSTGTLAADFEEGATGASPGLNHAVTGATAVPLNEWHHAAATYDGTWRLYLDGRLDASAFVGQPPRSDSIQHFGVGSALNSTGVPAGAFAGQIDEVRVWDHARTASEISATLGQHVDSGTGLLGSWRMDEGTGTTAADSTGHGWTGTLRNGTGWSTGFEPPAVSTGPATPSGVTATGGPGSVQVSWDPASGATGYQVFRETKTPVPTTGTPVSGTTSATSYADGSVAAGVPYAYVVRAVDAAGNVSPPSATVVAQPSVATGTDPVLLAAGDIAACDSTGDDGTATLLDGTAGTVQTVGDNAYPDGTATDFASCYDPTWGRHRWRTRPEIGNHEYHVSGAGPYWDYFGTLGAGSRGEGWYSYDLGTWHVVVLNSECTQIGGCDTGSPEDTWLRQDLTASAGKDVLAVLHHSRFSSATNGADATVDPLWRVLYAYGADVVLSGHRHVYERFAPQNPDGVADPAYGIRQFTVGTGGSPLGSLGTVAANSEARDNTTYGVLRLTLKPGGYDWSFLPAGGAGFRDSGSGVTHAAPGANRAPVVDSVTLSPSSPQTDAVLSAAVTAHDPDGDALSYTYTWRTDGVVRRTVTTAAATDSLDLSVAGNGDPGQVVSVQVVAADASLSSAASSAQVTVAQPVAPPAQPTGLTVTPAPSTIRLGWTVVPGAAGYHVYRSQNGGTWQRLDASTLTSPAYADSAPVVGTLGYRVTAVDSAGTESVPAEISTTRRIAEVATTSSTKTSTRKLTVAVPAGASAGDVLVAAVTASGAAPLAAPAGWTAVRSDTSGSALRTVIWTHVVQSGEPTSYAWSTSSTQSLAGIVTAYRGVDTARPVTSTTGTATTGSSLTAPSTSSTAADSLLVGCWAVAGRASFTPASGMSEEADVMAWASSKPPAALSLADQLLGSPAVTGGRTATASVAGSGTAQLVVLAPVLP